MSAWSVIKWFAQPNVSRCPYRHRGFGIIVFFRIARHRFWKPKIEFHIQLFYQADAFFQPPNVIWNSRLHCRGDAQGLVNPGEIIVHEVEGNGRLVVLHFLWKGICQLGEPPHGHPHCEICKGVRYDWWYISLEARNCDLRLRHPQIARSISGDLHAKTRRCKTAWPWNLPTTVGSCASGSPDSHSPDFSPSLFHPDSESGQRRKGAFSRLSVSAVLCASARCTGWGEFGRGWPRCDFCAFSRLISFQLVTFPVESERRFRPGTPR